MVVKVGIRGPGHLSRTAMAAGVEAGAVPVNTEAPVITGDPTVGETLTLSGYGVWVERRLDTLPINTEGPVITGDPTIDSILALTSEGTWVERPVKTADPIIDGDPAVNSTLTLTNQGTFV